MADYIGGLALQIWLNLIPSSQWANQAIEQHRGLPFGTFLHKPPTRRQRALTIPITERTKSTWTAIYRLLVTPTEASQHTDEQLQCGFLQRLPLDVRLMIYEMVLGGRTHHLYADDARSRIRRLAPDELNSRRSIPWQPPVDTDLLPLLLSCRRIYSEAIETLYSANIFEFSQIFTTFTFLTQMLPAHRLKSLRHLRIHMRIPRHPALNPRAERDWDDLWSFFTVETSGLQSLYLELQMLPPTEDLIKTTRDEDSQGWISPMLKMASKAYEGRGCETQLQVRQTRHDLPNIYLQVSREQQDLLLHEIVAVASAKLHKDIRESLEGVG